MRSMSWIVSITCVLAFNLTVFPARSNADDWTPDLLPNLQLWMDASDTGKVTTVSDRVSEWLDKSGKGRILTQGNTVSRPHYTNMWNGKNVITFDGTTNFLQRASEYSATMFGTTGLEVETDKPFTVIVVGQANGGSGHSPVNANAGVFVGRGGGLGGAATYVMAYLKTDGNTNEINQFGMCLKGWASNTDGYTPNNGPGNTGWNLLTSVWDGSDHKFFTNGTAQASYNTVYTVANQTTAGFNLGVTGGGTAPTIAFLDGEIAEVIILDTAIADDHRYKIEGYLAHKWGLTASLPSGHPYADNPPTYTPEAPTVTANAAVYFGISRALLGGEITAGLPFPDTYLCVNPTSDGPTDNGTNGWWKVVALGPRSGAFSGVVTGLGADQTYVFRVYATNSVDEAWSDPAVSFDTPAPVGSLFDPNEYTAAPALTLSNGHDLDIDTKNGTTTPVLTYDLHDGEGGASNPQTVNGHIVASQSGNVRMALFCFESLNIGSGVDNAGESDGVVKVLGNLGVVLASRGNLTFDAGMSVAGTAGQGLAAHPSGWGLAQGQGGPGADGSSESADGNAGGTTQSAPPGAYGGDGGWVQSGGTAYSGRGFGGGGSTHGGSGSTRTGGGGGYGGAGGSGTVAGGGVYGDTSLVNLLGGSGAGGAGRNAYPAGIYPNATGGGGGGSLALVARGTLSMGGTLSLPGGTGAYFSNDNSLCMIGGGGSGGGVLLAANAIVFSGAINARGGNGVLFTIYTGAIYRSGNGGGGRVAFYTGNFRSKTIDSLEKVNGDLNGNGQGAGGADFEGGKAPFGLTFTGSVDVRGGTGGNAGAIGSFYALYAPPPAGTVFIVR
jgi:hypothetical protein